MDEFSEALEIACGIATAKGTRDEDSCAVRTQTSRLARIPLREVHTSDSIEPPFARDHRLTMVLGLLVIAAGLGVYYLFTMARWRCSRNGPCTVFCIGRAGSKATYAAEAQIA